MSTQKNILFYSNNCKTCGHFMQLCQQNGMLKYFELVCIDGNTKHFQNKGLKQVPTITIAAMNKVLYGKDVFIWLDQMLKQRSAKIIDTNNNIMPPEIDLHNQHVPQYNQQNINIQSNNINTHTNNINTRINNTNINNTNINNNVKAPVVKPPSNIFGFIEDEMSGISDSYAYLVTDSAMPKSFLPYGKSQYIYTGPEEGKINESKQASMIRDIETIRNNDKNEFDRRIKQEHDNILKQNKR